jgi:EpsI family protein
MFVLVLLGSAVAFLSNSIRIYIVVLSGHYTQMTHSLIEDHVWLGWVVFSIFYVFFMFMLNYFLNNKIGAEANVEEDSQNVQGGMSLSIKVATMLIIAASVGPALSVTLQFLGNSNNNIAKTIELPQKVAEWQMTDKYMSDWIPEWMGPDSSVLERYQNELGNYIDVYVAYYADQAQGKEVVNSENRAFDRGKWKIIETSESNNENVSKEIIEYKETIIRNKSGNERLLWQWYEINDKKIIDDLEVKFYGLLALLKGKPDASAYIVSMEVNKNYSHARENIKHFVVGMNQELTK